MEYTLDELVDYMDSSRIYYQVYYDFDNPTRFGVVEHVDCYSLFDFSYDPNICSIWCSSCTTRWDILREIEFIERSRLFLL